MISSASHISARRSIGNTPPRWKHEFLAGWAGNSNIRASMSESAGSTSAASVRVVRSTMNVAIFFATLALVCGVIRSQLPFPEILGVYQKWLYFRKHQDAYDVLFIGSSRLYHQVIPLQFDEEVKSASGKAVRSFNFGYDGMWPPESFWLLRKLLQEKPARLRWVFIDCIEIVAKLDERNSETRRTAYWHDWTHTRMAWDAVAESKMPFLRKWDLGSKHGTFLLRQWLNKGRGAEWLAYRVGVEKRKKTERWDPPKAWKDREGFEPEKDIPFAGPAREEYEQALAERRRNNPKLQVKSSYRRALDAVVREVRAAGAEPILLTMPVMTSRQNFTGLPNDVAVWRYDDPDEYPLLSMGDNHYDGEHLNHAGAQILTKLLAERFAREVLKAQ